jgi:hypothetical protein
MLKLSFARYSRELAISVFVITDFYCINKIFHKKQLAYLSQHRSGIIASELCRETFLCLVKQRLKCVFVLNPAAETAVWLIYFSYK